MVLSATDSEARVISLLMNPVQIDMGRFMRDKERPDLPSTIVQRQRERDAGDHQHSHSHRAQRERGDRADAAEDRGGNDHGDRGDRSGSDSSGVGHRGHHSDHSDRGHRSDHSDHSDRSDSESSVNRRRRDTRDKQHRGGDGRNEKYGANRRENRQVPLTAEEQRGRDAEEILRKKVLLHQMEMIKTMYGITPDEPVPNDATVDDVAWMLSILQKQVSLQQNTDMVGIALITITGVLVKLNQSLGHVLNIDNLGVDVAGVVSTQRALLSRVSLELPSFNVSPIGQLALVLLGVVYTCHTRDARPDSVNAVASAAQHDANADAAAAAAATAATEDVELPDLVTNIG